LLCHRLPRVFEAYGYLRYLVPVDSFGIGLESGPRTRTARHVSRAAR
jgi:hypothetical protein